MQTEVTNEYVAHVQSPRGEALPNVAPNRTPVLARKLKQMAELQLRPDQILIRDKLGFFLGVVNLW